MSDDEEEYYEKDSDQHDANDPSCLSLSFLAKERLNVTTQIMSCQGDLDGPFCFIVGRFQSFWCPWQCLGEYRLDRRLTVKRTVAASAWRARTRIFVTIVRTVAPRYRNQAKFCRFDRRIDFPPLNLYLQVQRISETQNESQQTEKAHIELFSPDPLFADFLQQSHIGSLRFTRSIFWFFLANSPIHLLSVLTLSYLVMSAKAVREYHGKKLLARHVNALSHGQHPMDDRSVLITPTTDFSTLVRDEAWLTTTSTTTSSSSSSPPLLVVKPDQLIKRRGKAGLVGLRLDWDGVKQWISERMGQEIQVEHVTGTLDHFIVEPFVPHNEATDEYYIGIQSHREGEEILFYSQGGVDVGDVDCKAQRLFVDIDDQALTPQRVLEANLLQGVPVNRQDNLASFLVTLFQVYRQLNFTYMEINPIVYTAQGHLVPLDLAAKIDETAAFLNAPDWGHLDFPPPFGRNEFPEEAYIRELDSKTGASLKVGRQTGKAAGL